MYEFILYKTASYMLKTNPHLIIFQLLNPNFIQEGETYIRQLMQITFIYSLNKFCDKAKRPWEYRKPRLLCQSETTANLVINDMLESA